MLQKDFKPALRFMVVSDVHYKDEKCIEEERMEKAIKIAYRLCDESENYKKLDALYVVGDFANSGTENQMLKFKNTLDTNLRDETQYTLMMASHEFHSEGVEAAYEKFQRIFNKPVDDHRVINGFHFINLTCSQSCNFHADKIEFAARELKKAREADPKKPIFVFQHPHITDTVYGSILWGEDELYTTYMDYPQIINFSGHSHVPINNPRSIHQNHFTSLGTGSLSYTELDEFDKYYGTLPPHKANFAQMLIVEADADMRVRIYPYDLITSNFFPFTWEIDSAWDVDSYLYTDARYKTTDAPYFEESAKAVISDVKENGFTVTFDQAKIEKEYVDDYNVIVKNSDGVTVRNSTVWSEYYFYNMPDTITVAFDGLEKGKEYQVFVYANSFWDTRCEKPLVSEKIKL